MTNIGGHRLPGGLPGLEVYRDEEKGTILKLAFNPANIEGIHNEARMLRELSGTGFAPELIEEGDKYIIQEDLGKSQPMEDGEVLRRNATWLLWTLRQHRIFHGDLSGVNLLVKDDRPMLIDFQQSCFFDKVKLHPQMASDSFYLWKIIAAASSRLNTADASRVIRRWFVVLEALGGLKQGIPLEGMSFLDLGCCQGDFCAMAAAEGMTAHGVDSGGFRSGEDSIAEANIAWAGMSELVRFSKQNALNCGNFRYDVVILFSTWPYIVKDYGKEQALKLLDRIMSECGVMFFETQLSGDGPGPDFLGTDDDVASMLCQFGTPKSLVTIPNTGRPGLRTVWKVTK